MVSHTGPGLPGSTRDDLALRDSLVRLSAGMVGLVAALDPLTAVHIGHIDQRVDEQLLALRHALEEAEALRNRALRRPVA